MIPPGCWRAIPCPLPLHHERILHALPFGHVESIAEQSLCDLAISAIRLIRLRRLQEFCLCPVRLLMICECRRLAILIIGVAPCSTDAYRRGCVFRRGLRAAASTVSPVSSSTTPLI